MKVKWTKRALDNLDNEANFIAQDSEHMASIIVERIKKSVKGLENHPYRARPGRVEGTRELVIPKTSYIIPYTVNEDTQSIEIIRVLHTSRKYPDF